VLVGGIVLVFVVALGLAAYGLNNVVNPPPPSPSSSFTPAQTSSCPPAPSGHPAHGAAHAYPSAPPSTIDPTKSYVGRMCTNRGLITFALRVKDAPVTVNSFVFLAQHGFYDGLTFHRVCPSASDKSCGGDIKIAQGGDPNGNGRGGPGYSFADEKPVGTYTAGTFAMANSGANTNGSQFFINTGDNGFAPNYNIFGDITSGLDVAKNLVKGDRMIWVDIQTTEASSSPGAASPAVSPVASPLPVPSPSPS